MIIRDQQRAEGEPRTMARVQGMIEERFPGRAYNVWVTRENPRRHIAVKFKRVTLEVAAATWLDALDAISEASKK